jgi:hypothetical protein
VSGLLRRKSCPLRLTPAYRPDRDLLGRGPRTPQEVRVSAHDLDLTGMPKIGGSCRTGASRLNDEQPRPRPVESRRDQVVDSAWTTAEWPVATERVLFTRAIHPNRGHSTRYSLITDSDNALSFGAACAIQ